MKKILFTSILLVTAMTFGQIVKDYQTGGIYLQVADSGRTSAFIDSATIAGVEFIGEGFNGDTIYSSFTILNTVAPTLIPDLNTVGLDPSIYFDADFSDTIATNESLIGTIRFVPNSPADSLLTSLYQSLDIRVGDTVSSETIADTTTHIFYSLTGFVIGFAKGDKFQNIDCQAPDTATMTLTDSCGFYMEDVVGGIEAELLADTSQDIRNVVVSQSIAEGFVVSIDTTLRISYEYDWYPSEHHLSGECWTTFLFVNDIAPGYTCPVDSIFPVTFTNGNGGTGVIQGQFGLDQVSRPIAGKTVSNGPIEGATVYLLDPTTGNVVGETVTDVNGEFEFTGLADGSYNVSFRYAGQSVNGSDVITVSGTDPVVVTAVSDGSTISVSQPILTASTPSDSTAVTITIYPNPTTENATITSSEIIKLVTVVSLKGVTVQELTNDDNDVMVTGLDKGTYVLNIVTENSTSSQRLVVK